MTTLITLRAIKGSPLTNNEMDTNFSNLRLSADNAQTAADAAQASVTGLPYASATVAGLIKIGGGLAIDGGGIVSTTGVGPPGPQGVPGPTGPPGPTGATGANAGTVAAGAVGSMVFALVTGFAPINYGDSVSGLSLLPTSINSDGSGILGTGAALTGTWKCLGYAGISSGINAATLFVRTS